MSDQKAIVIASAARTAVGAFNGAFANIPAHELGATVIKGALERAGVPATDVDEVILGQVLTAGEGQNPARQAAMDAGCPKETTAFSINQLCGSGLRAVALGMQQILSGDAKIIVAGGQESMSMAPHCAHLRSGVKMGDFKMIDTMLKDGLIDAFHGYHMGITAENIASQWQLTRADQDEFALASQQKAEAAQNAGRFEDEIVPFTVKGRKGDIVISADEYIRPGTTIEALTKLKPAFDKEGTVTAGNASGINDGAAAVVLMDTDEATKRGVKPLARIVSGQRLASIRRSWEQARFRQRRRRWKRQAGASAISIWSKPTKPLQHSPVLLCVISVSTRISSTSMAEQSRSVIRSAHQAHAF